MVVAESSWTRKTNRFTWDYKTLMTPLRKGYGFGSSLYGNTRVRGRAAATRASPLPHEPPRLAFCILPHGLSVPVHPVLLCQPGAWRAAALLLPGRRRPRSRALEPRWEAANHPWGSHCLRRHCQHRTGQPSLPACLLQLPKMNWVGGSR